MSDSPLRRGLSDTVLLTGGSVLGVALGLVSLRLLLTGLSEEDYGRYALFLVAGSILLVFLNWPNHAVLRLGAEEWEERSRVGRIFASVGVVILSSFGLVAGVCVLAGGWIDAEVGRPVWTLALAFAGLGALAQLGYSLLQPAQRVGWRTLFPAFARAVYVGLLLWVVLGGHGLDLEQAIVLLVVSVIPAAVLPLVTLARRIGAPAPAARTVKRTASFAWPLLLRNLGVTAVLSVDLLVITRLLPDGAVQAGRYDVAYRIAEQVVVFGFVLEFLAGPILATAAARNEPGTLRRFYRLAVPPLAWLWALGAALLVPLAEPILTLLGAKSAETSAAVLKVLCLAVAFRGVNVLETPVFEAHLLSRWPTVFFFVGFGVNLAADVAFIEAGWGILGCAVGTLLGFGLQAVLRSTYIGRRFGVSSWRPYLAVSAVALLLLVDHLAGTWWALGTWALACVAVVLVGRRVGLFPAEGREVLAEVRMPDLLRRAVDLLYARPAEEPA